ncbi:MAG: hypothetical protein VR68_11825 [Peptococcaceae bacterium BRH_c4a]|nr:MAG: hypothetical protein VR68_11825 [Peptococcaceae bacterium BRH_c4a]
MTINLLTITDPHHSGKGPEAYLPNPAAYKQDGLNILTECAELAREHNCAAVLIPGDVTDTHLMSDRVKTEFIEAIKRFPCPVIAIDGNHCKETTNREDLKAAPYGVLRAAGVIWDAYDNPFVSLDYGFAVTGHPYDENTDWDITQYCIKERLAQVTIHLTHGALMPDHPWYITDKENKTDREGRRHRYTTFNEPCCCPSSLVPDIIVNGHLHNGHEATYLLNGTLIVNYGAVCHLSRDIGEINRELKVGLVSIEGPGRYKARGIVLQSQRPGHECLSREKLEREIERSKNKEKMSEYLQLLGSKREIRTRDARVVIEESVKELGDNGKLPGGVAGEMVLGRCLGRLDRVSNAMEAKGVDQGV